MLVLREALGERQCLDWFLREDFLAEGTLEQELKVSCWLFSPKSGWALPRAEGIAEVKTRSKKTPWDSETKHGSVQHQPGSYCERDKSERYNRRSSHRVTGSLECQSQEGHVTEWKDFIHSEPAEAHTRPGELQWRKMAILLSIGPPRRTGS